MIFLSRFFLPAAVLWTAGFSAGAGGQEAYFTNVAGEVGLDAVPAQRTAFVDLDGDGLLDCVLGCIWKEKSTFVFLNRGGKLFEDFTEEARLTATKSGEGRRAANVLIFADVDNDGDMDAFSGIYCDFQNPKWEGDRSILSAILLNDGKGVFSHALKPGVDAHPATTCAATFLDYDNDGWIDLFVGNWYSQYGASLDAYQDRLYRGLGEGRFVDVTDKAGLTTRAGAGSADSSKPVYGAGHCDYDNDGFQDILVCVYGRQWNFLWQNLGGKRFKDVAAKTGFDGDAIRHGRYPERGGRPVRPAEQPFRSNGNTFSVACADYDLDGDIDLFLGEITHSWAGDSSDRSSLLINQGPEAGYAFRRVPDAVARTHADPANWNQGDIHVAWIDFDNDGLQDLLIASGDYPDGQYLRLFRQRQDQGFEDITVRCGFDWESSGGISIGDYDRDGDQDILAGKSWMRMPSERRKGDHPAPALFRNEVGNQNNWITIRLHGKGKGQANRYGVGARITVEAGGRTQTREIYGGCGHSGQFDPPEAHFGIGKAKTIDRITVRWPDAKLSTQVMEGVEPNRVLIIGV